MGKMEKSSQAERPTDIHLRCPSFGIRKEIVIRMIIKQKTTARGI
jgi:hypothetical protein